MFQTTSGQIFDAVEGTMDVAPDGADYTTTLTIEWRVAGSEEWQTRQVVNQQMAHWDDNGGAVDKVRGFIGQSLNLVPECHAAIDVAYA